MRRFHFKGSLGAVSHAWLACSLPALLAASLWAAPGTAAPKPSAAAAPQGAPSAETPVAAFRRFAMVVGTNYGGPRRVKLRYAHSDAAAFARVLTELGGVKPGDLAVLNGPDRWDFLAALDRLKARMTEAAGSAGRLELLVYFSGHSDETGLLFGSGKVPYGEFRSRIDSIPARIRLAVVDACASGALTRLKGGKRLPAFTVDQSSSLSGYAFLTSSSGNESAQESDRIRASYFTHYLVTGLRGAADLNVDGKVTLSEAYEFAFHETLSQTEGSQAGAQHPSYDMRLTGTGDLVLTDLRGTSAGLVLDPALKGRVFVRTETGALVAELQKNAGKKVELGLEPGTYDVSLDRGETLVKARIKVDADVHAPVDPGLFTPVSKEPTRSRGDGQPGAPPEPPAPAAVADAPWVPARVAFVPALGYPGGPASHNLSLNLLAGSAQSIRGFQFSLGYNGTDREMSGLQLGAFNSNSGDSRGMQLAFFANAGPGDHSGFQAALLANVADTLRGLQAGTVNHAGNGRGLQVGMINTAGTHTGIQAGVMNFARKSRGLQAGLVNYASHSEAAVLGLINIIGNGLHDFETTFDEKSMLRSAFLLGGPYNYNYVSFDMKGRHPRHLWGGSAGLGIHLPRKPFFADADLGMGMLFNEVDWDNCSVHMRARGLVGYSPLRYLSLFLGFSYNAEAWPATQYPNLNPDKAGEAWGDDIRAERWPGFMVGVRI